jgi:hypothetical protein
VDVPLNRSRLRHSHDHVGDDRNADASSMVIRQVHPPDADRGSNPQQIGPRPAAVLR